MLSRLTCQSIYFQLSELNVNLLFYLGLIDALSAKKHAENFACVLIGPKLICDAWILFGKASVISEPWTGVRRDLLPEMYVTRANLKISTYDFQHRLAKISKQQEARRYGKRIYNCFD